MSRVDRLLDEFAAAFASGQTDPWPFLDQTEGEERVELDNRIEQFLLEAEPEPWDRAAYESSPASRLAERLAADIVVPEEGWRELLPSMRMRNEIKREEVSAELARELEASDARESEKVADYYNDMEHGNLDPQGVSDRVLESLSKIYGTTVEVLRRAGEATPPTRSGGHVFTRSEASRLESEGTHLMAYTEAYSPPPPPETEPGTGRIKGSPDRIDRLFVDVGRSEPGR